MQHTRCIFILLLELNSKTDDCIEIIFYIEINRVLIRQLYFSIHLIVSADFGSKEVVLGFGFGNRIYLHTLEIKIRFCYLFYCCVRNNALQNCNLKYLLALLALLG